MSKGGQVLDIRVKLSGEVKTHFLEIKNAKGLTNNTEVLRVIINEYYESKTGRGELRGTKDG